MGKKRPKSSVENDYNLQEMIKLEERGVIDQKLTSAMRRPAYYGTSLQQKDIPIFSQCNKCGYFGDPEKDMKDECTYPFDDPSDIDKAVFDYLPCREDKDEEN